MTHNLPDKQQLEAILEKELAKLNRELTTTGLPLDPAHWIPDYVFSQVVIDVYEQASAALLVARGPDPRAAAVNARAALEGAVDMYVLLAEPSLYDEMGAFARACELLMNVDARQYAIRAAIATGTPLPPDDQRPPEEIVEQEAREWDTYQSGVSVMYKRVLSQAVEDGRWKRHWSGLGSYAARVEYLARKHGAPQGFMEMATMWYRKLTQESHPGLRTGRRSVNPGAPGRIIFSPKEGSGSVPLSGARFACEQALNALQLRRQQFR